MSEKMRAIRKLSAAPGLTLEDARPDESIRDLGKVENRRPEASLDQGQAERWGGHGRWVLGLWNQQPRGVGSPDPSWPMGKGCHGMVG